jgi:1-acyl-sn-glycerol-3-phosphate acyltransferase
MKRKSIFKILDVAYSALTHSSFINSEFLPKTGPLILATNHMSRLDFPLFGKKEFRDDWTALVADSYKSWPVFNKIVDDIGMIWIDRTKADFTAFKQAFSWLKEGKLLVLAPEGTRSRTAQLLKAKSGIVLLAMKSGVPVCTGSVTGTENFMNEFRHFRKPRISMRFSPPYVMPKVDPDHRDESLEAATDDLMCRIAAMLPDKYHGYYKDNPRINQLREEWQSVPDLKLPE